MASHPDERRRRLAYLFAALSMALLLVAFSFDVLLEVCHSPRSAAEGGTLRVLHRTGTSDQEDAGGALLELDASLRPRRPATRILGEPLAAVPLPEGIAVFSASRATLLREGNTLRSIDLGGGWTVLDAVRDPSSGELWVFGWADGKIQARIGTLDGFGCPFVVAEAAALDRFSAAMDGPSGPWVAWREKDAPRVKSASFDGTAFVPRGGFEIGRAIQWAAVPHEGRLLFLFIHRDDRTFDHVLLRLRCCEGCGGPPVPESIRFSDPLLLLGRKITGISASTWQGRLVVVLTRFSSLQAGSVSLADFRPAPGGEALLRLDEDSGWKRLGSALAPLLMLMLFCSFALVFVGVDLLRARLRRARIPAAPSPAAAPVPADLLQRAMAHVLDVLIVMPAWYLAVEMLDLSPDQSVLDLGDPKVRGMMAVWFAMRFLYHFLMEWLWGRTLGKRILSLRVLRAGGGPVGLGGALLRNLVRPLDADHSTCGVLLGAILISSTRRRQRLGDLLARTLVVEDPPEPEEAPVFDKAAALKLAGARRARRSTPGE